MELESEGKPLDSVIFTRFWFLLVNQLILLYISFTVILLDIKNGGYIDEDGCGSSGVWNISPDISLGNLFL